MAATEAEINKIVNDMNQARRQSDWADTVVFEPQQLSGTRYKYVLTTEFNDRRE